jgi:hypothetical protein
MSVSDDLRSGYANVPILTKDNFPSWQLNVRADLTPNDHVRVIKRVMQTGGTFIDPTETADAVDVESWTKSQ